MSRKCTGTRSAIKAQPWSTDGDFRRFVVRNPHVLNYGKANGADLRCFPANPQTTRKSSSDAWAECCGDGVLPFFVLVILQAHVHGRDAFRKATPPGIVKATPSSFVL
jgi:hypothetical protein